MSDTPAVLAIGFGCLLAAALVVIPVLVSSRLRRRAQIRNRKARLASRDAFASVKTLGIAVQAGDLERLTGDLDPRAFYLSFFRRLCPGSSLRIQGSGDGPADALFRISISTQERQSPVPSVEIKTAPTSIQRKRMNFYPPLTALTLKIDISGRFEFPSGEGPREFDVRRHATGRGFRIRGVPGLVQDVGPYLDRIKAGDALPTAGTDVAASLAEEDSGFLGAVIRTWARLFGSAILRNALKDAGPGVRHAGLAAVQDMTEEDDVALLLDALGDFEGDLEIRPAVVRSVKRATRAKSFRILYPTVDTRGAWLEWWAANRDRIFRI